VFLSIINVSWERWLIKLQTLYNFQSIISIENMSWYILFILYQYQLERADLIALLYIFQMYALQLVITSLRLLFQTFGLVFNAMWMWGQHLRNSFVLHSLSISLSTFFTALEADRLTSSGFSHIQISWESGVQRFIFPPGPVSGCERGGRLGECSLLRATRLFNSWILFLVQTL